MRPNPKTLDIATGDTTELSLIDKRHTDKSAFSNSKIKQDTVNALLGKYSTLLLFQNGDENFDYIAVQPYSAALETQPFRSSMQADLGVTAPVKMI